MYSTAYRLFDADIMQGNEINPDIPTSRHPNIRNPSRKAARLRLRSVVGAVGVGMAMKYHTIEGGGIMLHINSVGRGAS